MKKLRLAFQSQRAKAGHRGILFLLSFDEWLRIWQDSGHLPERGCRRGLYVMARPGDRGAYEVGNVKIIKSGENLSEAHLGVPKSETHRAKIGSSHKHRSFEMYSDGARKAAVTVREHRRQAGNPSRRDREGLYA